MKLIFQRDTAKQRIHIKNKRESVQTESFNKRFAKETIHALAPKLRLLLDL